VRCSSPSELADRISPREIEAGFESLLDYYYFLRYDAAGDVELRAMVEGLVVHETYFFREWDQVRVAVDELIAPMVAAGRRVRVWVWSAACSTGEEPYSRAMRLLDRGLLEQVTIVASDLSERALAKAREGRYRQRSLRSVPAPHLVHRYLDARGAELVVDETVRRAIEWRAINLIDREAQRALGAFEVIFCRNVLFYFRDEVARRVVENLLDRLTPQGRLCVGISESLLRFGPAVECEERSGAFFYRAAGER
jgi:chemotaxis protein methyltransferase CheR